MASGVGSCSGISANEGILRMVRPYAEGLLQGFECGASIASKKDKLIHTCAAPSGFVLCRFSSKKEVLNASSFEHGCDLRDHRNVGCIGGAQDRGGGEVAFVGLNGLVRRRIPVVVDGFEATGLKELAGKVGAGPMLGEWAEIDKKDLRPLAVLLEVGIACIAQEFEAFGIAVWFELEDFRSLADGEGIG